MKRLWVVLALVLAFGAGYFVDHFRVVPKDSSVVATRSCPPGHTPDATREGLCWEDEK